MNYETHFPAEPADIGLDDDTARRRRRRIILASVAAAALVAVAATVLMGRKDGASSAAAAGHDTQAPVVTVMTPGQSAVDRVIDVNGSLAARREMPVGVVGEGGEVVRVLVEPGTWVGKGQVLAVIERSVQSEQIKSLAAQVEVQRAQAKLAQTQLDRAQALVARGFISKADIDQKTATRDSAVAQVNVSMAQLAQQRATTARLDIRAPEAGLVLTRTVEPGQVVSAGSGVLFRMAKAGEMEMLAQVSENDLSRISVGNGATVTPVGGTRSFAGHVWQISPVVDTQSRLGTARILLGYDPAIRPGGFASARIVSGSADVPLLPESAVMSDDKGNYVYIVDNGNMVVRRDVKVGQVSSNGVAVTAGITGHEKIVVSAGAFLNPGQKVKPELQKATK